jgi:glucan phosphoethanolaminetransferase (alkaline phosphatase superfamily)
LRQTLYPPADGALLRFGRLPWILYPDQAGDRKTTRAVLIESFDSRTGAATSNKTSRSGGATRSSFFGPAFAVATLMAPSVVASVAALSLHQPLTSSFVEGNQASGGWWSAQCALLAIGLSGLVASITLALYHWSPARRLLHLGLFSILLELFYRFAYGGPVSPGVLLSVPETSQRETRELLAGHPLLTGSLALVGLLTIYALVVSWRSNIRFAARRCLQMGVASLAMMLAALAAAGHQLGVAAALGSLMLAEARATYPFDVAGAFGEVAIGVGDTQRLASARARFQFPNVHRTGAAMRREAEVYVIVIGETSRRMNWSLYAYPRATTPRLDAIKSDLVIFERVSSNATNTILSVPLALTRAVPATRGVARREKSIVTLLRQAGFETYWISNQERSEVLFNPISQIAAGADHVSFPEDLQPSAQRDGYDSNLLGRLNQALSRLPKDGKAVFFLHMEGSHFGYKERYPAPFEAFRAGRGAPRSLPPGQMQLLDEYDNSIYFTDYNVRGIIDRLVDCRCRAGMIFFSDHGERLFDNGLGDGDFGHGFPTVSRQEIDVPFFMWLSPTYQQESPSSVQRLKANARSAAELSALFETVADLTGVDYANRSAARSLFSAAFQAPRDLQVLNTDERLVSLPPESLAGTP